MSEGQGARGETREVALSRAEQTLGRRVAESRATIPDLTLSTSIDMESACAAVCVHHAHTRSDDPGRSMPDSHTEMCVHHAHTDDPHTYTHASCRDMVVRACALALREHPRVNSSYRDGRVLEHARVNIAVTLPGASATPTIFDADRKSTHQIAAETAALARAAELAPPQLAGATFTVADLAQHQIESFTAAVSPGQAGVLALGAVAPRAVAVAGLLEVRQTMITTLACDQRVLDREPAAAFLERIRELLEGAPATLT